jgi:tetratricopeptide (TPR) repeat protein
MALSQEKRDCIVAAEIIMNIGNISRNLSGKKCEPLEMYEKALDICQRVLPLGHPKIGMVRLKIGDYYRYHSQYNLALEEYEDCIHIFVRSLPLDHVNIGLIYYGIGFCYQLIHHQNHIAQAISYLQKAAIIFRKHFSLDHWHLVRTEQALQRLKNKFRLSCEEND